MAPMRAMNSIGIGMNSKRAPSGVKGRISVAAATMNVAMKSRRPGRLRKKGLRVRITSTISEAEMTDSMNHPVRNISGVA